MSHPSLSRRQWLQGSSLVLLLSGMPSARGASIVAVRVWPAADYTRVTIESDTALRTHQTFVEQPPRLAVDMEGIELNTALRELVGKVRSDDPFILGVRIGQFNANTVRLVLDLRQAVKPQVFTLAPVQSGQSVFQHRLVLDLYPVNETDPLEALIAERLKSDQGKDPLGELIAGQNKPATMPS
ncbi:MAG: AMIN domain-containing protein, partial [Betaproteobacteria bacterium]|nr:AMIN domain-containing protein [Betaproteobacteria bacterium]